MKGLFALIASSAAAFPAFAANLECKQEDGTAKLSVQLFQKSGIVLETEQKSINFVWETAQHLQSFTSDISIFELTSSSLSQKPANLKITKIFNCGRGGCDLQKFGTFALLKFEDQELEFSCDEAIH